MSEERPSTVERGEFGPNIWLVDEMYQRFVESPSSVSEAWREFFEDYRAESPPLRRGPDGAGAVPAPVEASGVGTSRQGTTPVGEAHDEPVPMRGAAGVVAERMTESLAVPTATSVRTVPATLLEVNRRVLNNQLRRRTQRGKVSFTHLIGWAMVRALTEVPGLNVSFAEIEGKPYVLRHQHVNLGLAVDLEKRDGTRVLVVPTIKNVDLADFRSYWLEYEELIHRARLGRLVPEDFVGTTATLTNPGTLGTVQSVPRLMPSQGLILGVGAIAFPPEFQASDESFLARQGIGRILTITSTYDHRVIQGAQSGELLARIHDLLLGEDGFYDGIFGAMEVPYTPARWAVDDNPPLGSTHWAEKQANVFRLVNAYRVRGHLIADLDPLRQEKPRIHPELDPLSYGLTIWDLEREFATGGLAGTQMMKLDAILSCLRDAYCRTTGVEYMHIQEPEQKRWVQDRVEKAPVELPHSDKLRILRKLNDAEAFERFLHTKYVGHKRFGLEGAESLIPLLDAVLGSAAAEGMDEAVIGMAHRGRLNVLANIIGKTYERIFREFAGDLDPETTGGSGDVKYHLGFSGVYETEGGTPIGVQLVANPSHVEAVDPVLEGVARAKQEKRGADGHTRIIPVLIHGDAAFAGQGVVMETFNLSQLRGYRTGGTVHVVINNQVGFTTSALDARSSFYATDVAKTVQAPIIHVNGDDPEAVVRAARLAFAFRQAFHKDVVIDMICYRRRGHNEGDEPSYTQPLMYRLIENHRSVRKLYLEHLVNTGDISMDDGESLLDEFRATLQHAFEETTTEAPGPGGFPPEPEQTQPATAVAESLLRQVLAELTTPPDGFTVHPKLVRMLERRARSFEAGAVDWATAELLAIGSLARQGIPVRLAGEDSRRGTFSQRHAELTDFLTGARWAPLGDPRPDAGRVRIVDSMLSEFAAVGFEYGYSVERPEALVMWEAQFGDFANGAQVIIDQFVAPGEAKWGQQSALVLLLPHGYEGQGPEHSSGRIERFLELCGQGNMRVVVPSTSGQFFHLLRRQALAAPPKPLVVFTPKSLLRVADSFSPVEVLHHGGFEPVLEDPVPLPDAQRLVLCTGKVFHDLARRRQDIAVQGVSLARVAQLYPVPTEELSRLAARHPRAELVWCQEEPRNMGAYRFLRPHLQDIFDRVPGYAGRGPAASTATGSVKIHLEQQARLVDEALGV